MAAAAHFGCDGRAPAPVEAEPDPRARHLGRFVLLRRATDQVPFFLDRFETCESDRMAVDPAWHPASREPDLPLCSVSLPTAMALASRFWGRLPSFDEWRSAVEGSAGYRYPWGEVDGANRLRANTLALQRFRRTRAGTFESGRDLGRSDSPYDLFGNVAEWTLTPVAPIELLAQLGELRDRFAAEAARDRFRDRALDIGLLTPHLGAAGLASWPTTPFLPELTATVSPDGRDDLAFVVAGFSYAQSLPPPHLPVSRFDELGGQSRLPGEWAADLGLRIATDGYTLLSGLERMPGSPGSRDRELLAAFLRRHRTELRRALRVRSRLDRAWLGLPPPGAWAELAYEILGAP